MDEEIVSIRTFVLDKGNVYSIRDNVSTLNLNKVEIFKLIANFKEDALVALVQTKRPVKTTLDWNPTKTYAWFNEYIQATSDAAYPT